MQAFPELTSDIDRTAEGPRIAAFFDLDRTLLAGYSALAFFKERLVSGRMSPRELGETLASAIGLSVGRLDFASAASTSMRSFKGISERALIEAGYEIFERTLNRLIFPESRALVEAHQRRGHTICIASSASRWQVEPVASSLGIEHILCTRAKTIEGVLTGAVVEPICWGDGKRAAAVEFATDHEIELGESFFYTDAHEDLPLLDVVGNPRPVNPDQRLADIAAERHWPVLRFDSRGRPGIREIVGTSLVYGSLIGSALAALPIYALTGSKRIARNSVISSWADFGSSFAGLQIEVSGEHHLYSHRPAVFIFNHQSGVDPLIVCKLVRADVTGIGKEEARRVPVLGQIFSAMGIVWVDRFNHGKAMKQIAPALEALRSGTSLIVAPEGSRSTSKRMKPFKKGAFHLAMQARVPLIPIVIHNAIDAMPKHDPIIRPTKIYVDVLPPVMTDDWSGETLNDHVSRIREMMLTTLGISEDSRIQNDNGGAENTPIEPADPAGAADVFTNPHQS